jgi:hypothetical protein
MALIDCSCVGRALFSDQFRRFARYDRYNVLAVYLSRTRRRMPYQRSAGSEG